MASLYSITNEGTEIALVAATAKTVMAVFGATAVKGKLVEWGVSFDGVTANAEPVQVNLRRMTVDDGTRTTTVVETQYSDPDNPTSNCVGRFAYTVEGTKGDRLESYEVHPQSGLIKQYPLGREPGLDNTTANGLVIECIAPAAVNCLAYMVWEE